jgi:hypothetical protein
MRLQADNYGTKTVAKFGQYSLKLFNDKFIEK